jgi:hypothetical protein
MIGCRYSRCGSAREKPALRSGRHCAQIDVVAHADLVAVIEDRRSRHRQQQALHQLDATEVVFEQRRQAAANADIDACTRVGRVHLIHVVAFLAGHHFERQLVVVAQEDRPLAVVRDVRRLLHDFDDRMPDLLRDRHVHARHQREVIRHMALVTLAEILAHVFRPLVGLGEQQPVRIVRIDQRPQLFQYRVRLRQVLIVGAFTLDQVGDRVQAEAIDSHVEPEPHHAIDRLQHLRIVEVQIRLVRKETVPVVRLRDVVPGPVGFLGVGEDDAGSAVASGIVAPDVEIALARSLRRAPRGLKPGMLIRRMVDDELGDHAQPVPVCLAHEQLKVSTGPVGRMHVGVVGHVIAVVSQRRRVERQQPDRVDPEVLHVVQPLAQTAEVADAVVIGVVERLDVQLVDDRILVPERIGLRREVDISGRRNQGPGGSARSHALNVSKSRSVCTCLRTLKTCAGTPLGSSST